MSDYPAPITAAITAARETFRMPQGTVKSFDRATRTARVLDDELAEHAVDREAFAASGLLELRIGQRVRFEIEDDPEGGARLTNLNVVSL